MSESSAEICRRNNWTAGTILEAEDEFCTTQIVITAVGERCVLAKAIMRDSEPVEPYELNWTLEFRKWRKVGGQ